MKTNYENSIFYTIHSCSKYFDKMFEHFFAQLNIPLSPTELLALRIISEKEDCSQRDLARTILKDRANTGKIAKNLEEKGMITITLKMKNNRPSKILEITQKGKEINDITTKQAQPLLDKITKEISKEALDSAV
ncbi:MarR family transcriptional regulator, partial [bacterium]|nr:MarR family transcriptional regulator [bacterium]